MKRTITTKNNNKTKQNETNPNFRWTSFAQELRPKSKKCYRNKIKKLHTAK